MPTILETIREYEADILEMIAEGWGIDLQIVPGKKVAEQIAAFLGDLNNAREVIESLPEQSRKALSYIAENGGKMIWEQFTREFGKFREMGRSRREKERPDRNPSSESERVYYLGLIGRAFFDSKSGLKEYAYIPKEWLPLFNTAKKMKSEDSIPLAKKCQLQIFEVNDFIVDDATTLLAAIRKEITIDNEYLTNHNLPMSFLMGLNIGVGEMEDYQTLNTNKIKTFLEMERPDALLHLFQIWRESKNINELKNDQSFEIEQRWLITDPRRNRTKLLIILKKVPASKWILIDDFVSWVHNHYPDILRSGGEYDAWIVKDRETGDYLRGFDHWTEVEGQFLRYMITGPAHWLGVIELGVQDKSALPTHFRVSEWGISLLNNKTPQYLTTKNNTFLVENSGKILVERLFPRAIRYQISRFCDWDTLSGNRFIYRITPNSLSGMDKQGLKTQQLINILKKFGKKPLPNNLITAIHRWKNNSTEAVIESAVILVLNSPKALDQLIAMHGSDYVLERLNPTAALIKKDKVFNIQSELIKMGFLTDIKPDV